MIKEIIMITLSYNFQFKLSKYIIIYFTTIENIFLVLFLAFKMSFLRIIYFKDLLILIFILFYIAYTTIFAYLLLKSKIVKFNQNYLFFGVNENDIKFINLSMINRIKRCLFFFYKISFFNNYRNKNECLILFLSPKPPIKEIEKIKLLKKYAEL